jgi:iron complex outermembrane recepter protein
MALRVLHALIALPVCFAWSASTWAADADQPQPDKSNSATTSQDEGSPSAEVVVTGTKSRYGTSVQNAPMAISAIGAAQIQDAHMDTITDTAKLVPNVHL